VFVYRRTAFELNKAEEKAHILDRTEYRDQQTWIEVVEMIKAAKNPQEAKEQLISRFSLSEIQAQTILDMRLQRLTGLEREKIVSEYNEILIEIEKLKKILGDEILVMEIIKEEFFEIRDTYGDDRRTEIVDATDEILPEDLIAPEDMVITVTHSGYIKRNPVSPLQITEPEAARALPGSRISRRILSPISMSRRLSIPSCFSPTMARSSGEKSIRYPWPEESRGARRLSTS